MVVGEAEQDLVERCEADGTHLGASRHEYEPAWVTSHPELRLCSSAQFKYFTKCQFGVNATFKTSYEQVYGPSLDVSGML
jgi:hypothetical protein